MQSDLTGRFAEEYLAGLRCFGCQEQITANGCPCQRARAYGQHHAEVMEWLESLPESVRKPKGRGFRPEAAVRSTLTRERRRAGFTDMPVSPDSTATVSDDERTGLYRELGVKPKWYKPTNRRTKRADREPI